MAHHKRFKLLPPTLDVTLEEPSISNKTQTNQSCLPAFAGLSATPGWRLHPTSLLSRVERRGTANDQPLSWILETACREYP